MKFSIIVLTYNSALHIEKLIKSIYEFNKNGDYEIIIVDNASQDDTVKK
ncbi:MAG: glycosyltransferase, partial [Candidatus Levybacteria bacterium]|nr:glycosyltransferase [Candidatus Levybacteria bacterium]